MSSIVIGSRQMEGKQLETPKPSVARFAWALWGASRSVIARGHVLAFGEQARVDGWRPESEYWYVSTLGGAATPVRFTVECKKLVPVELAHKMLRRYAPEKAFVAPMVPEPQRVQAGDPVLRQPMVQGRFRSAPPAATATWTEAALWIELDGHRIKRIDWYWSAATPLTLFPGGAQVGDTVELEQVPNGAPGFPQIGWSKCRQEAHSAVVVSP